MGIIEKIRDKYEKLTGSQKKAADFILEHVNDIAFHTLDEIAAKMDVSTTTVIRLSRTLGYNGYSELQKGIQKDIRERDSLPIRLSKLTDSLAVDELFLMNFKNDIKNIENTMNHLDKTAVQQAAKLLIEGRNVYICGIREAFSLAYIMSVTLGQIKESVRMITGLGNGFPEEAAGIKEGDVCVIFTFPRHSKTVVELLQWMKSQGARTIIITSEQTHFKLENYADIILQCSTDSISFKHSLAAPMCLINYLIAATANGNMEEAKKQSEKIEKLNNSNY